MMILLKPLSRTQGELQGRNMAYSTKEARNAYLAKWRAENRDKTRAAQKRYYEANKVICNARVKEWQKATNYITITEWRKANPEKIAEIRKRHYKNNSAKEIARVRRRQGRIKNCELYMNQAEIAEIQGMYEFCRIFKGYEVDHIIPLNGEFVSGLHVIGNLQVLPVRDNRSKSNKYTIT